MKKFLSIFAWLVSVLLVAGILTGAGLYALTRSSMKVVQTWKQASNIQYDDATYYLSVVEGEPDWHGFPVHVGRHYFVYVGRESGTPTYGHMVDFSFYPRSSNLDEDIRQSGVEWSAQGVTLKTVAGDQLFVPKEMFMGGR